jgi:hypothetical protein
MGVGLDYLPVTVVSCSLFISAFWLFVKKGVYHGPVSKTTNMMMRVQSTETWMQIIE